MGRRGEAEAMPSWAAVTQTLTGFSKLLSEILGEM